MLDPIERVALGMLGCSSDGPPLLLAAGTKSPEAVQVVGAESELDPAPLVDWSTLQIQHVLDDEGRIATMTDDQMYVVLGLRDEDERDKKADNAAPGDVLGSVPGAVPVVGGVVPRDVAQANVGARGTTEDGIEDATITVDDLVPLERMIIYDKDNPKMELGAMFPSMNEFRLAVRQYAINNEFELATEKSCKTKFRGYCSAKDKGCPWQIIGNKKSDLPTITVTLLVDEHKCTSTSRINTRMASQAWVADKAVPLLRKTPSMGAKQLQDDHSVTIGYDTVWRGKERARVELYGSWEESFQLLYNWKAEIEKRSPGSIVEIDTKIVDGKVYFHRFFYTLKPCIEGFANGCRPYLSIDSTALNERWNGHLAAATAIDGHNWMYPLAYGLIDSETEHNWVWFMSQLQKAIGNPPHLAVCTDACKGLENAVKKVFPHADQRECFRHLMQNFIKYFYGDGLGHMYPAARAYRTEVFDHHMSKIVSSCHEVMTYLNKYHKLKWYRSAFNPEVKCDYITNNLAESFNNWIRDIKDLPVVDLVDKLREMIMILWEKRRKISERLHGRILPAIKNQLEARTRGLGHLRVVKSIDWSAEVWDNNKQERHVVKLLKYDCTCLEWQHTGQPCDHALCLITTKRNIDIEDYVHEYYSLKKFRAAYEGIIEPMPDKTQWPKVDLGFLLGAPLGKRSVGRQRKLRIKSALEGGGNLKKKKPMIRGPMKCKRCGEVGHREASSKCPLNGTKKDHQGSKGTTLPRHAQLNRPHPKRPLWLQMFYMTARG